MLYNKISTSSSHGFSDVNSSVSTNGAIGSPLDRRISSKSNESLALEIDSDDDFFNGLKDDNTDHVTDQGSHGHSLCRSFWLCELWSTLSFAWIRPLLELGNKRPLEQDDLGELIMYDQSTHIYDVFKRCWERSGSTPSDRSLAWTLIRGFGRPFMMAGVLKLFHDTCLFLGPVFLNRIIVFLKDPSQPLHLGLLYVSLLFISQMMMAFCLRQYFWWCYRVGMRLRSAIITSVFNKASVLSSAALSRRTTGEITNLMSVDSTRLQDLTPYLHAIWYSFYQIALALFLLWRQVHVASLAGLCVIIAGIPFTRKVSAILKSIQKELSKVRDERVKVCNEVFGGMKIVKFQAWEKQFETKILNVRDKELKLLRRYMVMQSLAAALYSAIPLLVSITTFTAYILLGNDDLDVSTVLTSLALFDLLRFPLFMLPNVINNVIEAKISVDRITSFLHDTESTKIPKTLPSTSRNPNDAMLREEGRELVTIMFQNGSSTYDSPSAPIDATEPMAVMKNATMVWEGAAARKVRRPREAKSTFDQFPLWKTVKSFLNRSKEGQAHQTTTNPMIRNGARVVPGEESIYDMVDKSDQEFYEDIVGAQQSECDRIITSLELQLQQLHQQWGDRRNLGLPSLNPDESYESITLDDIPHRGATMSPNKAIVKTELLKDQTNKVLTLFRINLRAYSGQIIAIIGPTGAGKSSLLSGFLGEIKCYFGEIALQGRVAYVGQKPFIQNNTVRGNILFGKSLDERKYEQVLKDCCLEPDLKVLPAGDMTEIGEKGINISGGQKSRIALARAVYSGADVFLLDDPLSAVDVHVGQRLFEDCILGLRERGACVLLVTNALQYLKVVDHIVVLDEGKIVDSGSYQDLLRDNNMSSVSASGKVNDGSVSDSDPKQGTFARLMKTFFATVSESAVAVTDTSRSGAADCAASPSTAGATVNESSSSKGAGKLTTVEDREIGNVHSEVYKKWLQAAGGALVALALVLLVSMSEGVSVFNGYWLSQFSVSHSQWFHLMVYALLNALLVSISFTNELFLRTRAIAASKVLFTQMLHSVLHAPMAFFDQTPIGRICNRFVNDMYTIDEQLPQTIRSYIGSVGRVVSVLLYISVILPMFGLFVLVVFLFYFFAQRYYIRTSRELTRLDSISRSPIYSLFAETLEGLTTIRAFRMEDMYRARIYRSLDANQRAYFLNFSANCWLGVRLDLVGSFIILGAALLAVIGRETIIHQNQSSEEAAAPLSTRLQLLSSLAGLAISLSLNCTQSLNWSVRMSSDLESQMVSVERVKSYSTIEQEPPHNAPNETPRQVRKWPMTGSIDFINVKMKYREDLPFVLKGLTFSIRGGEKVGVVGRTGAGKSSLLVCLMRLVELSTGLITIDGVDIATLPLHTLRSQIAVVPQDPVLFSGSLRSNLDPFNRFTDDQIVSGLVRCQLSDLVKTGSSNGLVDGRACLEMKIEENGGNLSVGQRQLLCIARALLSNARIIVMDEATAAVDVNTDYSIQKTIRKEFENCTCLTIAHRLNTIMDSDRVLVMSDGMAAEFDAPAALLENPDSLFTHLVANWESMQ